MGVIIMILGLLWLFTKMSSENASEKSYDRRKRDFEKANEEFKNLVVCTPEERSKYEQYARHHRDELEREILDKLKEKYDCWDKEARQKIVDKFGEDEIRKFAKLYDENCMLS